MSEEVVIPDDSLIGDNLIKCLSPFYFVLTILAGARVQIKDNTVRNIPTWHVLYSVLWIVLASCSCFVFNEHHYKNFFHTDFLMFLSCAIGTSWQNISYALTILVNRLSQREENVKVYAMLQKVDRLFGLEKYTYYNDFQYKWNIFVIVLTSIGFGGGFSLNAIVLLEKPIYTAFFGLGLFTIYIDSNLGSAMLYFLAVRVRIFNTIIQRLIAEYKGDLGKKPKVTRKLKKYLYSFAIPTVQTSSANLPREKWIECLQHLLNTYKMSTKLFDFAVFSMSLKALIWTYVVISANVIGLRKGLYPLPARITLAMWAGYYYFLLIVYACINDWFIAEIKKTKLLCIRLISYDYEGPYQKTASEMINIIHYDTPVWNVYGIFILDKTLPLEIIGVVASNALVLVQFLL